MSSLIGTVANFNVLVILTVTATVAGALGKKIQNQFILRYLLMLS